MALDYAVLRNELLTDPTGLGYAPVADTSRDAPIADLLNAIRGTILLFRGVIPSYEIINATVPAEWAALTAAEKQRYQTLTGAGQVDVTNANVRSAFAAMFGAGTGTRDALINLAQRTGSRAEQLFGNGIVVAPVHVGLALRSS